MTARHIPSPTNDRINLHQEYLMRTGGYDELARVEAEPEGWTTFAAVVASRPTLTEAVRAIVMCHWMSETDWRCPPGLGPEECDECIEVARS